MAVHTQQSRETTEGDALGLVVPHLREWSARDLPGLPLLGLGLLALLVGARLLGGAGHGLARSPASLIGVLLLVLGALSLAGLTTVAPGQARVVQLFGRY